MSFAIINLTHDKFAIVDSWRFNALNKFSWRAVKAHTLWYAKTTIRKDGKDIDISMHRFIAQTPRGMVCHHRNHNSLDNREANLDNQDKRSHTLHHKANAIRIKRDPNYIPETDKNQTTPTGRNLLPVPTPVKKASL